MTNAFTVITARVVTDSSGVAIEVPALLTSNGVLEPLLDYCLLHWQDRSLGWMEKVVRSVRLFVEYAVANPQETNSHVIFRNFAHRLRTGTYNPETGLDATGLGWLAKSKRDERAIIRALTDFFDWLSATRPAAANINSRYAGNAYDRMVDELAYQHRRSQSLLGHGWSVQLADVQDGPQGSASIRGSKQLGRERTEPPAFPEECFVDLLTKGFRVGNSYDYRGILITLLLNRAGFRESEPFHLYMSDVTPDPANKNSALVLLHHPSQSIAPGDWRDLGGKPIRQNRGQYLRERWQLVPRNELRGSLHAGWKGGAHENLGGANFYRAYWFEPMYGELFLAIWYRYLRQVAEIERNHPFAFVNLGRDPLGGIYKIGQYNKAHAEAVRRIGLTVSKSLGTTPHGHRHAYGRRLVEAQLEKRLVRRFLHHVSPHSQDTYTQATSVEMLKALTEANERLLSRNSRSQATSLIQEFC
jgi:hypothetical protein